VVGAWILLHTPQSTFMRMVPWLILAATLVFAFGNRISSSLKLHHTGEGPHAVFTQVTGALLQLLIAVYGGFFGAGIGILMLALLTLLGMRNINTMNAYKNLLATCINGVAVVAFLAARAVFWRQAALMIAGSTAGGYGGGYLAQRMSPKVVRGFVITVGVVLTVYFFIRTW
jgi:uncharacterized membrane protein YfcA